MNRLQACIYKDFTWIHENLWMQVSYETFLLVFTSKLYKDFVQVKKSRNTSKFAQVGFKTYLSAQLQEN